MKILLIIFSFLIPSISLAENYFSVERLYADNNRTLKKIDFCDFESSVDSCKSNNFNPSESSTYHFEKDLSQNLSYLNLSAGYLFALKRPYKVNFINTTFNPMISIGYNFGYLNINVQKNDTFLDAYGLAHGFEIVFMDDSALSLLGIKPVFKYKEIEQLSDFIPTYLVGKNSTSDKHHRTNSQYKGKFVTWGGSIGTSLTKKNFIYIDLLSNDIESSLTVQSKNYKLLHKNAYSITLRFLNLN